jgi:predicted outer membrane repeat protein
MVPAINLTKFLLTGEGRPTMKFYRILVPWVLSIVTAFLIVPSSQAGNAAVSGACSETEFNTALDAVQTTGGGTITFDCGSTPLFILLSAPKTITQDMTIDGGGVITLNGGNATRLFVVNAGVSLTLNNIFVIKGYSANGDGGAIYNSGALNINNCKFLENHTSSLWSGGAIVTYGPLNITNSEFAFNMGGNGGAIYPRFAPAVTTIRGSRFHDNGTMNTTNGWGGAILAWDGAPVTIEGSDIVNNSAISGGGIYIFPNSSVTLNGCMVHNNTASSYGGGFYNDNGMATLTNVTLSGNMSFFGGGIYHYNGMATLTNVTLSGNSASGGGGGFDYGNRMATLTNVTFSGNSAAFGGGFYSYGNGMATLTNVTFSGNSASEGGGIYHVGFISGRILSLKNSIVANSPAGRNCFQVPTSVTNITSSGFNLSSDTSCASYFTQAGDQNNKPAQLGPLANNGGFTLTHLPLPPITGGTGPIDNGSCPVGSFDQRGVSRPQGLACDIGAVEYRQGELTPWLYLPLIEK